MIYPKLFDNPLQTREDAARALENLIDPLFAHLSPSGAQVELKSSGAHYQDSSVGLEGFSRALYGLVPYIVGGFARADDFKQTIEDALSAGSDPQHPDYWGDPLYYNQNFIEMGSLALMILMLERYQGLSIKVPDTLIRWLSAMQAFEGPKTNNQMFFRLFALMAIQKRDRNVVADHEIEHAKRCIDQCYKGGGWYNDGPADDRYQSHDYYNAMGFHFYGLIYAALQRDDDPEWSQALRQRSREFAEQFKYWFDDEGRAVPFGRSLIYRSAQSAFWAALAYAGEEALPWGQIKSLVLQNLRQWSRAPIFTETGLLTIGYRYPNQNMSEEYNSPTSPYWALKPFLLLALPTDHPFWLADEEPVEKGEQTSLQRNGRQIVCSSERAGHVVLLNSGNWRKSCFQHIEEKCAKFAYSSYFGFNVSTGNGRLDKKAPDNTLLFTDDGYHFKERGHTFDHEAEEGHLASSFSPWSDVEVRTWISAIGATGHLRVHRVRSERQLTCVEGGFALPRTDAQYIALGGEALGTYFGEVDETNGPGQSVISQSSGLSGIFDPRGTRAGRVILHAPNSNVIHPRAVIPTLSHTILNGETYLVSLIVAHPDPQIGQDLWSAKPGAEQLADMVPKQIKDVLHAARAGTSSDAL